VDQDKDGKIENNDLVYLDPVSDKDEIDRFGRRFTMKTEISSVSRPTRKICRISSTG